MESTGSTTSKSEKKENSIPKEHMRFLPSITEQALDQKQNKKKLQTLFDKYLKPSSADGKNIDVQKEWGK